LDLIDEALRLGSFGRRHGSMLLRKSERVAAAGLAAALHPCIDPAAFLHRLAEPDSRPRERALIDAHLIPLFERLPWVLQEVIKLLEREDKAVDVGRHHLLIE